MSFSIAAEYTPAIEKTAVIVFINGKKYYVHTVKSGETLYSIAKAYKVDEKVIKEHNPNVADGLRIDQTVKIPVPEQVRADARAERKRKREFLSHKIKAGETLYAIARDYNISVATLREDNPSIDPQSLTIGDALWIRKAEIGSSSEEEAQDEMAEYADNLNKAADNGYKYHVVQPGETIYSLSRRYGITEAEFTELNDVAEGLKAGAMVRIPDADDATAQQGGVDIAEQGFEANPLPSDENVVFRAVPTGQTLDVALMLPLSVDSKPNASYVEFYQGFLLGLEDLKAKGKGNIDLTVYNTEHNRLKVEQIVSDQAFAGTDLIVGPVYEDELNPVMQFARDNSVPVVSPLANISAVNGSVLYQLSPDPEKKYDKIADLVDGGRDIYLIYASSYDKEFEQEVLTLLQGRNYASYTYSFNNQRSILTPRNSAASSVGDMTDILKNETPCLFVVLANSEIDVDRILGTLASANTAITERSAKSAPYTVLGTSRWGRFNNIDHTSFFNNNVVMISTYHAKRDSEAVRDFDSRYIRSYHMLPSLYAYRGYDTAMIFCEGMRSDIEYNLLDARFRPLQTEYKFAQKQRGDKYMNQEWVRVNYNRNYTITLE